MNLPARGRAGGKVILLGEHAVVYGRPALAAGLARGLVAEVVGGSGPARLVSDRAEEADDARLATLVGEAAAAIGLEPRGFVVHVRSELAAGVGLGSSAALAVAVLRALAHAAGRSLAAADELALARRLEGIFHGNSSGIDPAAAALPAGGCFRFVRGEPPRVTPVGLGRPLSLVIAYGGGRRSTGAAVGALRARFEADPPRHERLFDEVALLVESGARAAAAGDLVRLGRCLDENQTLLETLGVSSPEAEALVAAARRAGALGAKLTGGGGAGAVIALAAEPESLAARLGETGATAFVATIGGTAAGGALGSVA